MKALIEIEDGSFPDDAYIPVRFGRTVKAGEVYLTDDGRAIWEPRNIRLDSPRMIIVYRTQSQSRSEEHRDANGAGA